VHALAYNLGRAVALLQAIYVILLAWSVVSGLFTTNRA